MAMGPSVYDAECTAIREATHAQGVCLIVIKGDKGSGFSVQATTEVTSFLSELLRAVAKEIDRSGFPG